MSWSTPGQIPAEIVAGTPASCAFWCNPLAITASRASSHTSTYGTYVLRDSNDRGKRVAVRSNMTTSLRTTNPASTRFDWKRFTPPHNVIEPDLTAPADK